ncbi:acetolactate synthase small subunit [Chryseobacterium sp. SIMBA_029]|uniref:acetolactate synthase small subunit n=1 Tax=Chryseobacterium sp. SIMBA_029 TaxID=3085772 RepID=UPI00397938D7
MNTDQKEYMITAYIESHLGSANRINTLFSRRRINIISLSVGPSEASGIKKMVIVIKETEEAVEKLTRQIEKQIDVLEVHHHQNVFLRATQHININ